MRRSGILLILALAWLTAVGFAWKGQATGPYKVIRTAKVGGEGNWDYIYADTAGRRLYIPRGASRGTPATDTTPAVAASVNRIMAYDLDSLQQIGEIPDTGGNGVSVCPGTGHGFSTSHPAVTMFDTKTLTVIKKIDLAQGASGDGLLCNSFNNHVYIYSHPTKDATVIDAKDGAVLGVVNLEGTPEQSVADGKGTLYVVMQTESNIAVVDEKTMKTTAHYDFKEKGGRCNGLALDAKNQVLFVACGASSMTPAQGQPAQPTMVIMSAKDGKILTTLPLAGSSDGAAFNPATLEAFSAQGNGTMTIVKETSPTTFEVEQNLQTMNGARTITFDSKTGHLFVMSQERGAPPAPAPGATPPPGGRAPQGAVVPGSFTILEIGK
jgi:hypothetical protein